MFSFDASSRFEIKTKKEKYAKHKLIKTPALRYNKFHQLLKSMYNPECTNFQGGLISYFFNSSDDFIKLGAAGKHPFNTELFKF